VFVVVAAILLAGAGLLGRQAAGWVRAAAAAGARAAAGGARAAAAGAGPQGGARAAP